MNGAVKGFNGKNLEEIAKSVRESVEAGQFEATVKKAYPDEVDNLSKLVLWTAIQHNMNDNRREYFKRNFGIILQSYYDCELSCLSQDELIAANIEISHINEELENSMNFLSNYKKPS